MTREELPPKNKSSRNLKQGESGKQTTPNIYMLQAEFGKDRRVRFQWLRWTGLALLLLVVGVLAYVVESGLMPLPIQLAFNPAPEAPAVISVATETPTEFPTKIPTKTNGLSLTLTPNSPAMDQGVEATVGDTPSPAVVTPVLTKTPTRIPSKSSTPVLSPTPVEPTPASVAQAVGPTPSNTPRPATMTPTRIPAITSVPTSTPLPPVSTPASVAQAVGPTPSNTPRPATMTPTRTPAITSVPTSTPLPPVSTPVSIAQAVEPTPSNTPSIIVGTLEREEQVVTITPNPTDVGWWTSTQTSTGPIRNSFLLAGVYKGQAYISTVRFDLSRVPSGAPIQSAVVRLTGLSDDKLDLNNSSWIVQLLAESALPELPSATFFSVYQAPVSFELTPSVKSENLGPARVNEWILDDATRDWLSQQLLDGTASILVRILPLENSGNSLFAWDSGYGSASNGAAPELILTIGPPP